MQLSPLTAITQGKLLQGDTAFAQISTDTRTINSGEIFLALLGENFDGHDYIQVAEQQGAVGLIVARAVATKLPMLLVGDTLKAYGAIAHYHRQQFNKPVVALTGSCGKTTTKAMLKSILQQKGRVLATLGTFNNAIGVPKTLLSLQALDDFAVIELGTNHPGEIDYIARLTEPTIALITNAGPSHLEFLGDLAGVAREKGAIFNGLGNDGIAILNRDDAFYSYWLTLLAGKRSVSFGLHAEADVRAENLTMRANGHMSFALVYQDQHSHVDLPILGKHNVMNALAASACALVLDLPMSMIKTGLELLQPESKRLVEKIGKNGAHIIDDSYNANPASVVAAIDILAQKSGKKILVLGQMNELGEHTAALHQQIGSIAKQAGIDELHAFGDLTRYTVESFGVQGFYYTNKKQLIAALLPRLASDAVIIIKGSRGMQMEQVVEALL